MSTAIKNGFAKIDAMKAAGKNPALTIITMTEPGGFAQAMNPDADKPVSVGGMKQPRHAGGIVGLSTRAARN